MNSIQFVIPDISITVQRKLRGRAKGGKKIHYSSNIILYY